MTPVAGWAEVSRVFDRSGSLYFGHRLRKGYRYRLRISSYDAQLLNDLTEFFGSGTVYTEHRKPGTYYRFELNSRTKILAALERMLPDLTRKKTTAEDWIRDHR